MSERFSHVNVWVHDQDEALAFYTDKLGMEVREDVTVPEMNDFRWLTVGPPPQPDVAFVLMEPTMLDPATAEQLTTLMAKGVVGGLFLATDDCRARYEELKAKGVEFQEEPTERIYGVDAAFRDPSGNNFRLVQRSGEWAASGRAR
jgi:catechol 2,3-dioxygenase-like lactoylglutathione lyase family enzyme